MTTSLMWPNAARFGASIHLAINPSFGISEIELRIHDALRFAETAGIPHETGELSVSRYLLGKGAVFHHDINDLFAGTRPAATYRCRDYQMNSAFFSRIDPESSARRFRADAGDNHSHARPPLARINPIDHPDANPSVFPGRSQV